MVNNVRFFAGSKKQYLSLDEYSPLALYFCYDTRELFWGDLLLSDGMRVVTTFAELPVLSEAADGVVYFVTETRNGYVLSNDRTEWIQVIQAPNGGSGLNVDLSNYYTKSETTAAIEEAIAALPKYEETDLTGYATQQWVIDQGYLTSHIDINGKADKDHNHDDLYEAKGAAEAIKNELLNGAGEAFDTLKELNDLISDNKDTIESLKTIATGKADNVPFTSDRFVSKAVGGFAIGDNLNGLTITQIFAKLLELSEGSTEDPELPDEPNGIIETIMVNKTPMYAVTATGDVESIPYKLLSYTVDTAKAEPTESGFYQIKDADGNVVESGYQELQISSDETYYVIALPKEIDYTTMVTMQVYSAATNSWMPYEKFNFTCEPSAVASICDDAGVDISRVDEELYTIWAVEECPTGSKLRFIITE